ncbi:Unknown protein [Striga hermonthica]|uniref:Uncharacterized protein n=1 Tax=Striga hermonthica TaxID=68872 RepID=A0A9N7MLP1_STRHE|nr:Unknown protein [Striga hermonthica]
MRIWVKAYLLLLTIVIHQSQGTRLLQGSILNRQNDPTDKHREHLSRAKTNNEEVNEFVTSERKLLRSGKVRKLTMMSFTTIGKKDENEENRPKMKVSTTNQNIGGKDANNISVSSSPETYSGDLDIAGMDYSLAIRKPPIHN